MKTLFSSLFKQSRLLLLLVTLLATSSFTVQDVQAFSCDTSSCDDVYVYQGTGKNKTTQDGSESQPYKSIQYALDQISINHSNGHNVNLYVLDGYNPILTLGINGLYHDGLSSGGTIHINGETTKPKTGDFHKTVIANDWQIRRAVDLTFSGFYFDNSEFSFKGGISPTNESSNIEIFDNDFVNDSLLRFCGTNNSDAFNCLDFTDALSIRDNEFASSGMEIDGVNGNSISIENNDFLKGTGYTTVAINLINTGANTSTGATIKNNEIVGYRYGIHAKESNIQSIQDNSFAGSSAGSNLTTAIGMIDTSVSDISNNYFENIFEGLISVGASLTPSLSKISNNELYSSYRKTDLSVNTYGFNFLDTEVGDFSENEIGSINQKDGYFTYGITANDSSINLIEDNLFYTSAINALFEAESHADLINNNAFYGGSNIIFRDGSNFGNLTNNSITSGSYNTIDFFSFTPEHIGLLFEKTAGDHATYESTGTSSATFPSAWPTSSTAESIEGNNFSMKWDGAINLANVQVDSINNNEVTQEGSKIFVSKVIEMNDNCFFGSYNSSGAHHGKAMHFSKALVEESFDGNCAYLYTNDISKPYLVAGYGLYITNESSLPNITGAHFEVNAHDIYINDSAVDGIYNSKFVYPYSLPGNVQIEIEGGDGFEIVNNTFYKSNVNPIEITSSPSTAMTIANNIFEDLNVSSPITVSSISDIGTLDNNIYSGTHDNIFSVTGGFDYDLTDSQALGHDSSSYNTDSGAVLIDEGVINTCDNACKLENRPDLLELDLDQDGIWALDRGDDSFVITTEDYDKETRTVCSSVDMGAVEEQDYTLDNDGDGLCGNTDGNEIRGASDSLEDTDADGLTDYNEIYSSSTEPNNNDSDADGLLDGWEVDFSYDPNDTDSDSNGTNDGDEDTDEDGLSNLEEQDNGTYPNSEDSDGDDMPDGWEVDNSLDPLNDDSASDPDNDTYTNLEEYTAGTDPNDDTSFPDPDTDGDGPPDTWEDLYTCTDSTSYDSSDDDDSDGLTHLEEYTYGTDPCDEHSDGDLLNDGDEVNGTYGDATDPLNTDSDGDILDDYEEVITYGTDPNNTDSDGDILTDYEEIITYSGVYDSELDPNDADTDGDLLDDYEEVITYASYGVDPTLSDTDSDLLDDYEEIITHGTDPILSDTDGDNLDDYEEIFNHGTDPLLQDTDGDNLNDDEEILTYETNPLSADTDGDNLQDDDEILTYYTDPNNEDSDEDGLHDDEEIIDYSGVYDGELDPNNADTDEDGLTDYEEIIDYAVLADFGWSGATITYLDPTLEDSDGDTYTDGDEVLIYETDPTDSSDYPTNPDTDGDGMLDDWENLYTCTDYATDDDEDDDDTDGLTHLEEYTLGTDPCDEHSDGDLLNDGDEVNGTYGDPTDPLNSDSDNDGLDDYEELVTYATISDFGWSGDDEGALDPNDDDTDGDTIDDGVEVLTYQTDPTDQDSDDDGLEDNQEILDYNGVYDSELDPNNEDTDEDGLTDYEEVIDYAVLADFGWTGNTIAYLDPTLSDSDGDTFTDGEEVLTYETDPTDIDLYTEDYDLDEIPDTWEDLYACTDYATSDATDDDDSDGLDHLAEYLAGTDPCEEDTDGDTLTDGEEVNTHGTDPLDTDTDDDLFRDDYEVSEGTDPDLDSDTPDISIEFVAHRNITKWGDGSSYYSGSYYYSASSLLSANLTSTEDYYIKNYLSDTDGAFGFSYDEEAYLGTIDVYYCGTGGSSWIPTSSYCTSSASQATAFSDMDTNVDSDLSSYFSFSDMDAWYWANASVSSTYTAYMIILE
jgi:hypothetical protein